MYLMNKEWYINILLILNCIQYHCIRNFDSILKGPNQSDVLLINKINNGNTQKVINYNDTPCIIENDLCFCRTINHRHNITNSRDLYSYFHEDTNNNEHNTSHEKNVAVNILLNFLSICCQPKILRLHFYGSGIKYIIPEIFTQFACHEVIELTLESTLINISSPSSSSATSSETFKQHLLKTSNNLNYFIGLPNLIRLRLINNLHITCYASEMFNGISTHLQELYLIGNPVKEIKMKDFSKFTTNENRLITLDLSFNHLTNIEANSFVGLLNTSRMYYLRKLNLAHNHITYIHANMFTGLAFLEELNLADNPITFIAIESFEQLISLRKLIIINTMKSTVNNSINTNTLTRVLFKHLKDLQELNLIGLQMYNIQSNLFNDLHQLRKLNLAFNQLINVPIIYQYDNRNSSNILTYSTLLPLSIMIKTKLLYFNLSYNQITCLTANSFIHLHKLKYLILHDNLINIITRNAFYGLLSLEILDLQRNPLQLIQPLAFIPIKITLHQLLLNNVIQENDQHIIEYFNHTSLAFLSQTTKIIGLEKWDIYKGGNHSVDQYLNDDYTQFIDEDIDCDEDIKSIYQIYWKLIKNQHVSNINDKNENEQFTLVDHFDKNNGENQNVIIILFSTGMIIIILLSGILIPYRYYAYNTKWKRKLQLSKTNSLKYSLTCRLDHEKYLQNNQNKSKHIECNHLNHPHQWINVNYHNNNYYKLMKRSSLNLNNKTTPRLNSLLSRTNLFEKMTKGEIIPNTTSTITTTNSSSCLQNYNWFWLNPLQNNDIIISNNNIPSLNQNYLLHIQQNRDIQRQIYDELQMVNSGGSPQTTYLSDTSYYDNNLIKAQHSNKFPPIHMDKTTTNNGSNHGSIVKSNYIYPLTIYNKTLINDLQSFPINRNNYNVDGYGREECSANNNIDSDNADDEDEDDDEGEVKNERNFIKELGIL